MNRCLTSSARVAAAVCSFVLAGLLPAQEWNLSAHAGRIRSALDPASRSTESFALGLRYDDLTAGLRLSAGLPAKSNAPLWGGVAAWKRLSLMKGGLRVGVDLQGNALVTRDRATAPADGGIPGLLNPPPLDPVVQRSGHALAGQALPLIGLEAGRFQIHARAGASRYAAEFGGEQLNRSVRMADVQLTLSRGSLVFLPTLRHYASPNERSATHLGASVIAASRLGSLWASSGAWLPNADTRASIDWAAGARFRLHRVVTLDASARRDVLDPLYLQPAQTSWSIGMSLQLWRVIGPASPPVPARYVDGRATIRLKSAKSQTLVSIAGDFNAWKPTPMLRNGDDWTYTTALAPGVYNYAFVDADGRWFVPDGVAGRRDDGMGGHVAVLVVR